MPRRTPGRSSAVRRAVSWLAAAAVGNPEGAVYGALLVGVLLAAEDARRETYGETIGATAIVLLIYGLTGLYTHVLGVRLRTKEPLARALIKSSLLHELPLIEGGVTPVAVLVVAWATGASVNSGVRAAVLLTAISIIVLEIAAGWRARERGLRVWARAAVGALAGLGVVAVKVVLHV